MPLSAFECLWVGPSASIRLPECLGVPLTRIYAPRRHQLLVLTLSATECPPHQLLVLTQSVSSKLELESTLFHPVFAQYAPQIAELATAEWGQVMALTLPLSATDCPLSSALPQGGQPRTARAPPLRSTSRIATRRL